MEFEFDKEMDALLRQAARGEIVSANQKSEIENPKLPHLDADEISLFAENALPEQVKTRFVEHFADCGRCRKILSNVISLDAETVKKTVQASETAKISNVAPWYRRLFAVPNLAYALGALLLVFGGIIAYTILRSANDSQNTEIAQVESTEKMQAPNAGDNTQIIESNTAAMSNGGSMLSNSSTSMQSNSSISNAVSEMSNTSVVSPKPTANSTANGASVSNPAVTLNKRRGEESETAKNETRNTADSTAAKNDKTASEASGANFAEQKNQAAAGERKMRAAANDKDAIQADAPKPESNAAARSALVELPLNGRNANNLKNDRAKKIQSVVETRAAGGKTFRRENGVWYDQSYGGQATTNISRGSADFKKLDSGLRSIAIQLSGAVVAVWNGTAYRIQ